VIVERLSMERRVLASLEAARIPVVLGGCGAGRTSLLLRLARLVGAERGQYIDFGAAASTPERCLSAVVTACPFRPPHGAPAAPTSARGAFDALLQFLDRVAANDGGAVTFLVDEVLDVRTFESFPGLRHVQREVVARLAASPSRFVLASRFTSRVHRLLRDAPARFEVMHMPGLEPGEVQSMALLYDGGRREWAADIAPAVAALSGGRAAYATLLLEAMSSMGPATDPVAALASLLAPGGRLTARCRESYDLRLSRARGYGALKAILGILADQELLNLTEISHRLQRTPGSTKDYLSWLEDVDLVTAQGKRYVFADPLLRLYVRLYGAATPPTDSEVVREVDSYARARLTPAREPAAVGVSARSAKTDESEKPSGIIEID
jgi:hypothetical protein